MTASYLAYDATQVRLLQAAMVSACDELAVLRCDDTAAAEALRAVRRAQVLIGERWIPTVDRIVRCAVLTEPMAPLDPRDLRLAVPWVMATEHGWQVTADPLAADPRVADRPPTRAEVVALAHRLTTGDLDHLLDTDAERRWLTAQLHAIAADVALTRAFTAEFDRWPGIVEQLARQRVDLLDGIHPDPGAAPAVAQLDHLTAGLAAVWARAHPGVTPDVHALQPYAAATFLQHLRLDAEVMAGLATELLHRWHRAESSGAPWWDKGIPGPNTADLLFAWLATDPEAAAGFVVATAHDLPMLFASAADPAVTYRMVLIGTDPAHTRVGAGTVLTIVRGFAAGEYFRVAPVADGYDPAWQPFLGDLIAPWLLQFSPLATGWAATPDERRDLLAFVLDDARALAALVAAGDAAVGGVAAQVRAGGFDESNPAEVAALIGMLGELVAREQVADEAARLGVWALYWKLLAVPLGKLPTPLGAAATTGVGRLQAWSVEHRRLGAPDPQLVAAHAEYRQQWLLTIGGASMVAVGFDRMVARGGLPGSTPPPPVPDATDPDPQLAYERDYLAWKRAVFADLDDPRALELDGWKGYFLSAADAGRAAT